MKTMTKEEAKQREQKLKDGKIIEIKTRNDKKYRDMKPKEIALIFKEYLSKKSDNWKIVNKQYWILFFIDEEIQTNFKVRKGEYYDTIFKWLKPVKQEIQNL